MYQQTS